MKVWPFWWMKSASSRLKIPSGEITNGPFLLAHAQTGKNIIVSTGMANLGEVEAALGVLAFGFLGWRKTVVVRFSAGFSFRGGQGGVKEKVTLLHCTSEYPTPMQHVNLRAMDVLKQAFGLAGGLFGSYAWNGGVHRGRGPRGAAS